MMVIYLPVKFEFDWANRFKVRVRKRKCGQTDGWTDKRTKNGQTNTRNFTNFERNLAMMVIYLPVKFESDWSNRFKLESGNEKCGRTDRQTDVGHINLIGGLVTRNPPKKDVLCFHEKDAMTSGCLDRKEVRCATWRVQCEDRPAGGNTGRHFLTFGGPVCADRFSILSIG